MKEDARELDRYRLLKAAAIVLALVVAAPGVDAVARFAAGSPQAEASTGAAPGLNSNTLLDVNDAFGSLERIESVAAPSQADGDVPGAFAREIGFPSGARDLRVSASGEVVGYVVPGNCEDVLAQEVERMGSLGWTSVSLNGVQGSTFVKASGDCRWALVSCVQTGVDTSVVVRSVMQ